MMDASVENALELNVEPITQANEALANMDSLGRTVHFASDVMGGIGEVTGDGTAFGYLWAPLFEKIGIFMKIVDSIADVRNILFLCDCVSVGSCTHALRSIRTQRLHGQCYRSHSRFVPM
jgi:hypothetical protein